MKILALALFLLAAPLFAQQDITGAGPDGSAVTGNPVMLGDEADEGGSVPSFVDDADATRLLGTPQGLLIASLDHPRRIRCSVNNTAVVRTAFGGSCAAPGAGLSIYVTGIKISSSDNAAGWIISYGTGSNCGTGNGTLWAIQGTALKWDSFVDEPIDPPYKLPANTDLCWLNSNPSTKFIHIRGYIAP